MSDHHHNVFDKTPPEKPPVEGKVQTRSEHNGLGYHNSVGAAIDAAKFDSTIWKISFTAETGDHIRLIRVALDDFSYLWKYEPIV